VNFSASQVALKDVRSNRGRRKRAVRAVTINERRMSRRELAVGEVLYPREEQEPLPKTRGECAGGLRPCPFVSCSHNLYLDVDRQSGSIKLNFPDLEPEELVHSCALDVADRGGATLDTVGEIMNLTRERVRQIEVKARGKLRKFLPVLSGSL
jgi:hypothetical protein